MGDHVFGPHCKNHNPKSKTMLFNRALALTLLLGHAAAFNIAPSGDQKARTPPTLTKIANMVGAGVVSAACLLGPITSSPASAADSMVMGTPLETKLANFGAASYPVFNLVNDVTPLVDKFLDLVEKKVKPEDAATVAQTGVDGLLAIPDSSLAEYRGVLKQVVYAGVTKNNCVELGGSGSALKKFAYSAAVKSVPPSKFEALGKKFKSANDAVILKDNGNICLPGSVAASEKLWVAQAELTSNMPKKEAADLVTSIKKAGSQATRPSLVPLVPAAEGVFSKNPEATNMIAAGKDVEPFVIAFVKAALQ